MSKTHVWSGNIHDGGDDLDVNALVESEVEDGTEDEYDDDANEEDESARPSSSDEYNDVTRRSGKKIVTDRPSKSNSAKTSGQSKTRSARYLVNSSPPGPPPAIASLPKAEARKAFGLFFPSAHDADPRGKGKGKRAAVGGGEGNAPDKQKIKIKDLARMAGTVYQAQN